jgi:hypothetical protein
MSYENWNVYIKEVMRDIASASGPTKGFQVEANAVAVINDAVTLIMEKLSVEMHQLMLSKRQVTLTLDTVKAVTAMVYKGELYNFVDAEVSKAVKSFDNSDGGSKSSPTSRAKRANLYFNIGRVARVLKDKYHVPRVSEIAAVAVAAMLQCLTGQILTLAADQTRDASAKRITDRHIFLGIAGDEELAKLVTLSAIPGSGAVLQVHSALVPKKKGKKAAESA